MSATTGTTAICIPVEGHTLASYTKNVTQFFTNPDKTLLISSKYLMSQQDFLAPWKFYHSKVKWQNWQFSESTKK